MCGLAGFVDFFGLEDPLAIVQDMTSSLSHRGPDAEGVWVDEEVALGHRRLSIIDLSDSGRQPMVSDDGRFVLVYNGEIYNFQDLRKDLEARGIRFRGSSDTEVLLGALVKWGPKCLSRLNGMFALALFDRKKRELLLARDRYGVKPLYIYRDKSVFAFASEQKAFASLPSFKPTIAKDALAEYFSFQNFLTNKTLLADVVAVQPGSYTLVQSKAGHSYSRRYWDFTFSDDLVAGPQVDIVEELDRLFSQAVSRQMISDVPVGLFLSGGIDSGSIAAVASQLKPGIPSFTCGFSTRDGLELKEFADERLAARKLARSFGTEHREYEISPLDFENWLSTIVFHLEEPRVGPSFPNFGASRLASREVSVVLSGAGGDEIFGGYPWRYRPALESHSRAEFIESYFDLWHRLMPENLYRQFFQPIAGDLKDWSSREVFSSMFPKAGEEFLSEDGRLGLSFEFESKTFLQGILHVEDKLAMAHGIETRVPFLDNDLVDFARHLHPRFKIATLIDSESKGIDLTPREVSGKAILRDSLRKYVGEEIAYGKKRGFSAPEADWYRNELKPLLQRRLLDQHSPLWEFINPVLARRALENHWSLQTNNRLLIWSLLSLDQYLRTVIHGQPSG